MGYAALCWTITKAHFYVKMLSMQPDLKEHSEMKPANSMQGAQQLAVMSGKHPASCEQVPVP